MTQRKWLTFDDIEVLCGWDKSLQYFYVLIDRPCKNCNGTGIAITSILNEIECPKCGGNCVEFIYNNIDDPETDELGGMNLAMVKETLDKYLTSYDSEILFILAEDKSLDLGNDIRVFPKQGRLKEFQE